MVRVLLDHEADVASVDDEGKTPACLVRGRHFDDDDDDDVTGTGPFRAFEYGGKEWEGEEEHAACVKLMLINEPERRKYNIWAPRRFLMMLIARHRKAAAAAAAATAPLEHGHRMKLARGGGAGAPAALPAGGGASEGGPGEGGAATEGEAVAGAEALRGVVARLAGLGEDHLLRRVVRFL